jgi:hypothetical protein
MTPDALMPGDFLLSSAPDSLHYWGSLKVASRLHIEETGRRFDYLDGTSRSLCWIDSGLKFQLYD